MPAKSLLPACRGEGTVAAEIVHALVGCMPKSIEEAKREAAHATEVPLRARVKPIPVLE